MHKKILNLVMDLTLKDNSTPVHNDFEKLWLLRCCGSVLPLFAPIFSFDAITGSGPYY